MAFPIGDPDDRTEADFWETFDDFDVFEEGDYALTGAECLTAAERNPSMLRR